ncbi:MAG: SLC13 family permease, partial [Candidatus Binatia bacterium]|nr:SLC13 family permease [Candidatus Binatia bacterium]
RRPSPARARTRRAPIALAIMLGMLILISFDVLPMVTAALLTASAVVVLGCLSVGETRNVVDMSVLILIAAAFGVSKALEHTGAAGVIAALLVGWGAALGPLGVLAMVYLATLLATELLSNAAAAALMFPVAMEAAHQFGIEARPLAIAVTIAASAAFASPLGYQTHLMVYGPGGYRFSDFVKIGLPLNFVVFAVAMVCIPYGWPLTPA